MVECNLAKVEVAGSNPSPAPFFLPHCGSNSAVECQLPKLKVAGSNPVSRSRNLRGYIVRCNPFFYAALPLCHQWSFSEPRSATRRNPQTGTSPWRQASALPCTAAQGETGNPFPVYGGGFHTRKCWPKGQHHHKLRRKTDLCITFPHTVFFAAPWPVRGAPALRVLEIMVVHQTQ